VTLNGIIAIILRFHRIRSLCWPITSQWLDHNNVRKILSPSSSFPLLAITNSPCSAVSLAVSVIAELLVTSIFTFFSFQNSNKPAQHISLSITFTFLLQAQELLTIPISKLPLGLLIYRNIFAVSDYICGIFLFISCYFSIYCLLTLF